ncbi:hypothetical protein V6N13_019954 [Hibiscus sabdariffa]|uniref:Uncharacterized protein n=1 Tax=Hibiscus sabdariffa TaxID=183260 RepID=A0ABR2ES40_9ROSI
MDNGVLVLRGRDVGLGFRLWESRARKAIGRRKTRLERHGLGRRNRVTVAVRPWNEAWCRSGNDRCKLKAYGLGLEGSQGRGGVTVNKVIKKNGEVNDKDCQERRWGYGKGENGGEKWSRAQTKLKRVRGNSRLFVTKGEVGWVDGAKGE